ncbi:hypothetical protein C8F01DRAFT_1059307 [Mycena amicta]|nr:hypothetical protein C8F01DRAFT_1059307 [Mycena amicta]
MQAGGSRRRQPRRATEPTRTVPPPANRYPRHDLTGELPIFNEWERFAVDHKNRALYIYGGVRPDDAGYTPTNDLYRLDMNTMQWKNLTVLLRHVPQGLLFSSFYGGAHLEVKKLPALTDAASAIVSLGDKSFLMLFGGFDGIKSTASLICVDLDNLAWWYVSVAGRQIKARTGAAMLAHKNKLFIFGGRVSLDDDPRIIDTFSVATLSPEGWSWTVSDSVMTLNLGYLIHATLVYGGQKILLTKGRVDNDLIRLSASSTVLFHTEHYTFQDASFTRGSFPIGLHWYRVGYIPGPPTGVESESRPAKKPRLEDAEPFPASIVIMGWVGHPGPGEPDDLATEVWQYMVPPTERIMCLDLKDELYNLDLDLQDFIVVANRMFLLGNKGEKTTVAADVQLNSEQEEGPNETAWKRWDVAVEIPFGQLKQHAYA